MMWKWLSPKRSKKKKKKKSATTLWKMATLGQTKNSILLNAVYFPSRRKSNLFQSRYICTKACLRVASAIKH